jgi:hypothetical protein
MYPAWDEEAHTTNRIDVAAGNAFVLRPALVVCKAILHYNVNLK